MAIDYLEIRGQGSNINEARWVALEKLNRQFPNPHDIISLTEELIPAKWKDEPSVIYLHVYYFDAD